jgi:hypothetical protein
MRSQIANIAEKFNEQVIGQLNQAGKTYTKTNDRVLDAIVDTNRKAVDFVVKTCRSGSSHRARIRGADGRSR